MKKLILSITVVGLLATLNSSCKKDYTCECSVSGQTTTIPLNNYKKKDAEDACSASETTYKNSDPNATCSLK